MRRLHITRDLVLFTVGVSGIVYETVTVHAERPTLLIVFSAMIGLPVFLRLDGKAESHTYKKEEGEDDG